MSKKPSLLDRHFNTKSEVIVALGELVKEFYPGFTKRDLERWIEIFDAIPREDRRREDLIISIDQAYSENHDTPRMLTRKDFMQ